MGRLLQAMEKTYHVRAAVARPADFAYMSARI
jgi:hypothetical protein